MPEQASAEAPGRVNLIGEHTDYHDGYVLPMVIPQRTRIEARRRADRRVRAWSGMLGRTEEYETGQETPGRGWLDYVQGTTFVLSRHGVQVPGLDLRIESTVPAGAGVSSSAALEVSLLRTLRTLLTLDLDDVAIAQLARAVETDFVGAPIGIMDQMAASVGREGEALFLDTRTLQFERLVIPRSMAVAVIDSGVAHAHASGGYAVRRRESFEAAALLGVATLRDVDASALSSLAALPPILARRARHIVTENARVLRTVAALRAGEAAAVGALFVESHDSMRADYEISTREIDILVGLCCQHPAVHGARLTGGGFGGAVVVVGAPGALRDAAVEISRAYREQVKQPSRVLVPPDTPSQ